MSVANFEDHGLLSVAGDVSFQLGTDMAGRFISAFGFPSFSTRVPARLPGDIACTEGRRSVLPQRRKHQGL